MANLGRWLVCLVFVLAAWSGAARGQTGGAALIADRIWLSGNDRLIAEGNVEALQGATRIEAQRITYLRNQNKLIIDGPIRITDSSESVILADSAELDQSLRVGLLNGARLVMNQQLQLAAVQMQRVGNRYIQLSRATATSCQICGDDGIPFWQIRARRVIHDLTERQLYFEGAQFRVGNVPVVYLPRLRLPDPTLPRARGFLVPRFRNNSRLGIGVKVPYFIPIGDHKDITLTPYLSQNTRTVELRYRQAFRNGYTEFNGALGRDTLVADRWRGYIFGEGQFNLARNYVLEFDLETVSDDAYLSDYDYSAKDRLDSALTVHRTNRDRHFEATLIHFRSLRTADDNATLPSLAAELEWSRRFNPSRIGGEGKLTVAAHSHYRYSNANSVGRDLSRLSAELSWARRWTLPAGLRAGITTNMSLDHFAISQDTDYAASVTQFTPGAAVELRWPWRKTERSGATQLIEPLVQIGWSGKNRAALPNDESTRVEFDEGNLLSLSRFPEPDRRENGRTAAFGVRWERVHPKGWSAGLVLGQVIRDISDPAFTHSSGLSGLTSATLVSGYFRNQDGLTLSTRGLFAPTGAVAKADVRAHWSNKQIDIEAAYVLLVTDTEEDRNQAISEWNVDGTYRFAQNWSFNANWRYDIVSDQTARAAVGLAYENECVKMNARLSRKYTSMRPSTNFGLTVALKGFSTGAAASNFRRTCRN